MSASPIENVARGETLAAARSFLWRFVAILVLIFGMLYVDGRVFNQLIIRHITEVAARVVALNMQLMGLDVVLEVNTVTFRENSFAVIAECVGLEVYALYVAAVLATPAAFAHKLKGLAIGVPVLVAVNHARIITIITFSAISTGWIDAGHIYIWPIVLMILSIGLWLSWIRIIEVDPRLLE